MTALRPAFPRSVRPAVGVICVAYALYVAMLGTTLPTPLYPIYQQRLGIGSLLTTIVFSVYAGGVIIALLLFGCASDLLGRRPVLLAGLAVSGLSAGGYLSVGGLPQLLAARMLSGLSAGVVAATATVALVEMVSPRRQARAALLAAAVNMFGLGCGPLLAGLLAEFAPRPLRLPFLVDLVLVAAAMAAVLLAPETVHTRRTAWPRPRRLEVAAPARAVFVPVSVAVFAAFAVFGLLGAIEPGILATVLHLPDRALAGGIVFAMFSASAFAQVGLARVPPRMALPIGCAVLIAGLAGIAGALLEGSLALLFGGTIVVGVGQSLSFRAGVAAVTAMSPAPQRAGTVSSLFVVAYAGVAIPVVLVGAAVAPLGLRNAAVAFTAAVAVLSAAALVTLLRLDHRPPPGTG
jgi:predicted MFS family arabinose efflux permease